MKFAALPPLFKRTHTAGFAACVAIGVVAVLSACGGGGGPSATGLGVTTQSVSGTITGFGSVYIDGVRYDDSLASVRIEEDSTEPRSIESSALRLGMRVELSADDGDRAARIHVIPELQGPVSEVQADRFVVLGKTIRVVPEGASTGTPTVFEGLTGLAGLAPLSVGQVVEVHGLPDATDANTIVATRVELKTGSGAAILRLTGTISNPIPGVGGAGSFTVGSITVNFTAATRITPSLGALVAGRKVAIWSDTAAVGSVVSAKAISVRSAQSTDASRFRVSGIPANYNSVNKTFELQGLIVDASSATLEVKGGVLANLSTATPVRVKGDVVSDVFKAREIRFVVLDDSDEDSRKALSGELSGLVTDFVSVASFKVRGVSVDASSAMEFEGGTAAGLANGRNVKIEGLQTATGIRAKEVKFLP